jgi:3-dehydroquinate dehydratase-1
MLHIGNVALGAVPRVVLAVGEYSNALEDAYASGVSILEVRLDWFPKLELTQLRNQLGLYRKLGLPLIATLRPENQGGKWKGGEDARKAFLLEAVPLVDAVDIELTASEINAQVAQAAQAAGKTLIVSNHDFRETPSNAMLEQQRRQAKSLGADIVKLACFSESEKDIIRLLNFVEAKREQGMVGISMGRKGAISRVAAPLFGSLFTYTSMQPHDGQWPLAELVHLLRTLYPAFDNELLQRSR